MICIAIGEQTNKLTGERSYSPVTFSFPEYNRIPLCRRETLPLLAGFHACVGILRKIKKRRTEQFERAKFSILHSYTQS